MKDKTVFLTIVGTVGGLISAMLGGWDTLVNALLVLIAVDYVMGMLLAGVFQSSPKTESGGLSSLVGWRGLARKLATVLLVVVANLVDSLLGTDYIRDAAIIAFSANEVISIIENAGLMGLPIPEALQKGIDALQSKGEKT